MIQFKHQSKKKSVHLALQNCLSESEHHVLTQEEAELEAVFWTNLKRNLANKALLCLHKLPFDVTDGKFNGIESHRETESIERFFVPAMRREVCSLEHRICEIDTGR